eukprot:1146071-Pelagomonas_calceolata.AAC.1
MHALLGALESAVARGAFPQRAPTSPRGPTFPQTSRSLTPVTPDTCQGSLPANRAHTKGRFNDSKLTGHNSWGSVGAGAGGGSQLTSAASSPTATMRGSVPPTPSAGMRSERTGAGRRGSEGATLPPLIKTQSLGSWFRS